MEAFGAAVFGIIGVIVGTIATQAGQYRHWLREQKVEAFSAFIEDTSRLSDRLASNEPLEGTERLDWMHRLQSGRTSVHLLCDRSTVDKMEALIGQVKRLEVSEGREGMDEAVALLREFVEAARKEIRSTWWRRHTRS